VDEKSVIHPTRCHRTSPKPWPGLPSPAPARPPHRCCASVARACLAH